MEYLKIQGDFPRLTNSAVTLGKFDGLHRGHRRLIKKIVAQKENGAEAVVFAFTAKKPMLLTTEERKHLLEELGADVFLECPLNEDIRHMKAEAFVQEILVGDLRASYVAVGEDFRFGYERKGTPELLARLGEKYGFAVEILPKEMEGRRKVSSTYAREQLRLGNMENYASLAGAPFFVEGTVAHGRGMGHRHLLPTANIVPEQEKRMPPNGVYATISHFGDKRYPGITNIGYKPTVGETFLGVETYLYDCDEDLYGQPCKVEFLHFLRPERKFASLEALKEQILRDADSGRGYFGKIR